MKYAAEVFSSSAFRFALILALAFAGCATGLLVVVERSLAHYAEEAGEGTLESEAAILQATDREFSDPGRASLLRAIALHRRAGGDDAFAYRLVDGTGRVLVNDLGSIPAAVGWGDLALSVPSPRNPGRVERYRSLGVPMPRGGLLVVASDMYDIDDLRHRLDRFTIVGGVLIVIFAVGIGYVAGLLLMQRLNRVNAAIGRVIAGKLDERLPTIGFSPEFALLSSNLNAMLDRIDGLMAGLRQVTTDIAHDLRTPLTRLRQQLESLRDDRGAHDPARIELAIAQTDEILGIFRALLRIGMLEGGDGRQHFAPIDLSEIIGRVVEALAPVAEDSGHAFDIAVEPGLAMAGDRELIAQMLVNLIENAIRHTPEGSRIGVSASRVDGVITIDIADDGPGIPEAERQRVLTRFYRLDRSRTLPGSGLGLSLAAAIAGLHGIGLDLGDNRPGLIVRLTCARPARGGDDTKNYNSRAASFTMVS